MNTLNAYKEMPAKERLEHAQVSVTMIRRLCATDSALPKAQKIFEAMQDFGEDEEILKNRAEAALILITKYGEMRDFQKANTTYDSMAALGDYKDSQVVLAMAAGNLILDYSEMGEALYLQKAQALFDAMSEAAFHGEMPGEINMVRAKATANLIDGYCRIGDFKGAQALFDLMHTLGTSEELTQAHSVATRILLRAYKKAGGHLLKMQEIFDGLADLVEHKGIAVARTKAVFQLIHAYVLVGNMEKARKAFDIMVELGDHKEALTRDKQDDTLYAFLKMTRERAKVYSNMLHVYVSVGDLQKAYEIFESMPALGDTREMVQFRADAKDFLDSNIHQPSES